MLKTVAYAILWIVALFYGYGALVHILNMLGLTGFDWVNAPRKWQVLDTVYLVIDLIVLIGFFIRWRVAYVAFYFAAFSQILLYTVFRGWILEVPQAYAVPEEKVAYLTTIVIFHLVTLVLVTLALQKLRREKT